MDLRSSFHLVIFFFGLVGLPMVTLSWCHSALLDVDCALF
jgi:hypothetical protein